MILFIIASLNFNFIAIPAPQCSPDILLCGERNYRDIQTSKHLFSTREEIYHLGNIMYRKWISTKTFKIDIVSETSWRSLFLSLQNLIPSFLRGFRRKSTPDCTVSSCSLQVFLLVGRQVTMQLWVWIHWESRVCRRWGAMWAEGPTMKTTKEPFWTSNELRSARDRCFHANPMLLLCIPASVDVPAHSKNKAWGEVASWRLTFALCYLDLC